MRRSAFAFLLLAAPAALRAQSVADLVDRLATAPSYDDEAVGDGGERTPTWATYERLAARAPTAELQRLTRHERPVVRAYAVRALVEREPPVDVDWPKLVLEHARDTAPLATFRGCARAEVKAGDLVFELVRPRLTAEQLQDVAEAFVRGGSPLDAREQVLRCVTFRDGMLHDLRKLAASGEAAAAIALARFRLAPDVPLLIRLLQRDEPFDDNAAFRAAEISADPALLPALRALIPAARTRLGGDNAYRLRFWLAAIAAQRSRDAAALLADVLEQVPPTPYKRADLAGTMRELLQEHPDAVFDAVRAAVAAPPDGR